MKIEISADHHSKLKELCRHWFAVRADRPMKQREALENLIDKEYDEYSPKEYQTTGFDRQ